MGIYRLDVKFTANGVKSLKISLRLRGVEPPRPFGHWILNRSTDFLKTCPYMTYKCQTKSVRSPVPYRCRADPRRYNAAMRLARVLKLILLFFLGLICLGGYLAAGREGSLDPPSMLGMTLIRVGVVGAVLSALVAWLWSD